MALTQCLPRIKPRWRIRELHCTPLAAPGILHKLPPDAAVLRLSLDEAAAREAFNVNCSKRALAPTGLLGDDATLRLTMLPFWVFSLGDAATLRYSGAYVMTALVRLICICPHELLLSVRLRCFSTSHPDKCGHEIGALSAGIWRRIFFDFLQIAEIFICFPMHGILCSAPAHFKPIHRGRRAVL